jgi:GTP-binding protein HflX
MAEPRKACAILVAVEFSRAYHARRDGPDEPAVDPEESLGELGLLALTAGIRPLERVIQRRDVPDPAYFVGSGKAAELGETARTLECAYVIFDDDLSPVQARNLEDATGLAVLDRTQLILQIFAGRARTREGRLQVDLARLTYELPRLGGRGAEMSRLGASAGVFTRGPGETQLEAERRTIRSRISDLSREIEQLRRHRSLHREGRRRVPLPVISLVGYTNAGKSTLLNALTGADVLAEDKLFATLDPTTRGLALPGGLQALLSDTVGFIRKLPHALVAAFRATLEEVAESDLLLHVVDASSPSAAAQAATVRRVLAEAGAGDSPVVVALNKSDLLGETDVARLIHEFPGAVAISAVTGRGLDELRSALGYALRDWLEEVELLVPYSRTDLVSLIHERGEVTHQGYDSSGISIRATLQRGMAARLRRALSSEDQGER